MKPETRFMGAIFRGSWDDDGYYESIDGRSLREALMALLDEIAAWRINAPAFSRRVKPLILARFGFDETPKTYEQLGEMFDRTKERMRQHVEVALRMLRHPSRSQRLKPYIKENWTV